jgi:hypothetical protein
VSFRTGWRCECTLSGLIAGGWTEDAEARVNEGMTAALRAVQLDEKNPYGSLRYCESPGRAGPQGWRASNCVEPELRAWTCGARFDPPAVGTAAADADTVLAAKIYLDRLHDARRLRGDDLSVVRILRQEAA